MMNDLFVREYKRLRKVGFRADTSYKYAMVNYHFDLLWHRGYVDFTVQEDDIDVYSILCAHEGDEECHERDIKRSGEEGIWSIIGALEDPKTGELDVIDSVGGFIGEDWRDSGYDVDVKCAVLDAYNKTYKPLAQLLVTQGAGL